MLPPRFYATQEQINGTRWRCKLRSEEKFGTDGMSLDVDAINILLFIR